MRGIKNVAQTHQNMQTRHRTELGLDPKAVRHHVPVVTLRAPRHVAAAAATAAAAPAVASSVAASMFLLLKVEATKACGGIVRIRMFLLAEGGVPGFGIYWQSYVLTSH